MADLPMEEKPSGPPTQFHLFPKLPQELRWKIWGFATPPPWLLLDDCRPVPAVMHACKESREEFTWKEGIQKHHPTYKLLYRTPPIRGRFVYKLGIRRSGAVFISVEQDVVFFGFPRDIWSEHLKDLKHIALPFYDIPSVGFAETLSEKSSGGSVINKPVAFPKLEQLYVLYDGDDIRSDVRYRNLWFGHTELRDVRLLKQKIPEWKGLRVTHLLSPWKHGDSGAFCVRDVEEFAHVWVGNVPVHTPELDLPPLSDLEAAEGEGKHIRWATLCHHEI